MKTPIIVLDYTRNTSLDMRLDVIDTITRIVGLGVAPGLVLYGVRAYPLVEPQHAIRRETWRVVRRVAIKNLDGPPEPYRGVKEAVDMIRDLGLDSSQSPIILFWSAPRKPRVDVELAYYYSMMSDTEFSLIIMKPSPPRWLWRSTGSIPEDKIFYIRHNTRLDKLLAKLIGS